MSTLTIDVRRAHPQDSTAIAATHEQSWTNAYTGILPYRALRAMLQRRGHAWWERAIRKSTKVLVLDIGGEVVGYATLGGNRVDSLPAEGEIYELYLAPEYQGIGLGSKLFAAARQELKSLGYEGSVVWVLADNDNGVRFYENAGGRDVAEGIETFDGQSLKKIAYLWD